MEYIFLKETDSANQTFIDESKTMDYLSKLGDCCILILLNQVLHLLPRKVGAVHRQQRLHKSEKYH